MSQAGQEEEILRPLSCTFPLLVGNVPLDSTTWKTKVQVWQYMGTDSWPLCREDDTWQDPGEVERTGLCQGGACSPALLSSFGSGVAIGHVHLVWLSSLSFYKKREKSGCFMGHFLSFENRELTEKNLLMTVCRQRASWPKKMCLWADFII